MKYLEYKISTGQENMKIDSEILDSAINSGSKEEFFRLYGWSPKCISLGRNQGIGVNDGANCGVNIKENQIKGIDTVRRVTGGRALLHDDEITYCYVAPVSIIPNGESITGSYKYISGILIDFFKTLGINLDFGENKKVSTKFEYCMLISTGADVCYQGRKIIGSAQYRKQGYVLQHGSILFDYDKDLLENLFGEKVSEESICTVKEILPELSKEDFVNKFETFLANFNR